jgi:hypothetical protein
VRAALRGPDPSAVLGTAIRTTVGVVLLCTAVVMWVRKRDAFLDNFRKVAMFADDLSEFDDAREIAQDLFEEYRAAEGVDYINWGLDRAAASSADDPRDRAPRGATGGDTRMPGRDAEHFDE